MGMVANLLRTSTNDLDAYKSNSDLLEQKVYDESPNINLISLDKAWDGIIFLLTAGRDSDELTRVVFSGSLIDEEQDLGYGPAHYLTPQEVQYLNSQLLTIGQEELKAQFNPEKFLENNIYPTIWNEGEEAFEYLMEYFNDLKDFYQKASLEKQAVITFLN